RIEGDGEQGRSIFQAVGFFRVERGPTQAVLPLVGLATEKVIRHRYMMAARGTCHGFPTAE
ncbi:MAG: hypothetical protein R6U98_12135, partial [Pirellulaceae bacterium]